MEDDMWRADGSFRGMAGGAKGKGGGGKGGSGPQFNRVIPKFLQQFHQGPAEPGISTKFAPAPQPPGEEDGDGADELDDVQKAAINEYMAKEQQKKKEKLADAVGDDGAREATDSKKKQVEEEKPKKHRVASLGKSSGKDERSENKRKRKTESKTLNNKKLLSFSMDDDDA